MEICVDGIIGILALLIAASPPIHTPSVPPDRMRLPLEACRPGRKMRDEATSSARKHGAYRLDGQPTRSRPLSDQTHKPIVPEFAQEPLNLTTGLSRQDLEEILQPHTGLLPGAYVVEQQLLVLLTIQSSLPRVSAVLPNEAIVST